MIVTRNWLNEFVDLTKVSTQKIVDIFNDRGLEVASVQSIVVPEGIVIGFVKERASHPNADKLSVCQVDVGTKTLQIVCGAKNVAQGQWVAVAVEGVVLPNGLEIKPTVLRDVDSFGMLCSTTELGLPQMEDGIWVLDESLGELKAGNMLSSLQALTDEVIEIELTANRGDCLSVRGVARELGASLGLALKEVKEFVESEETKAIGRVFQLHADPAIVASLGYKVLQSFPANLPAIISFRLALTVGCEKGVMDSYLSYATHATGVVLKTYDASKFYNDKDEKFHLYVVLDQGIECVGNSKSTTISNGSVIGVLHHDDLKPTQKGEVILEASYTPPSHVALLAYELDLKTDPSFYKSSRGSEPDLVMGMQYLITLLSNEEGYQAYSDSAVRHCSCEPLSIQLSLSELSDIMGITFEKNQIIQILTPLGFGVHVTYDSLVVTVPAFRHDIKNIFDIAEELVRMTGIDNIPSRPLSFFESDRSNATSQMIYRNRELRKKAATVGFYETVHFIFDDKKELLKWEMTPVCDEIDLINPITSELDTLRVSLLPHLIRSAQRNVNNSIKKIPLFEVGVIYDQDRNESFAMGFVWSGHASDENITNHGKPQSINFEQMAQKMCTIFGDVSFESIENEAPVYLHPYVSAKMILNGVEIGVLGQLDSDFQELYDLPITFVAHVNLEVLPSQCISAKNVSRFQKATRDITLVAKDGVTYSQMRKVVEKLSLPLLEKFTIIDEYKPNKEDMTKSLTLRFWLQSYESTLTDDLVNPVMEQITEALLAECEVSRQ